MGVRREAVELSMQDAGFTRALAEDAAAVALLNRELRALNGEMRNTPDSSHRCRDGIDGVGESTRRNGRDLDSYSNRLSLLAAGLAAVGPAAAPITVSVIPALSGLTAEIGVSVAAIGVAVTALYGMTDAYKALNKYQLEPTTANLEKLGEAYKKVGPQGAAFVQYLDGLTLALRKLQGDAQGEFLPGLMLGIDQALNLLPKARTFVREISSGLGQLSAEAGGGLNSRQYREFFDYLNTDARPTLIQLGHSLGNISTGLVTLMTDMAPLTRDFSTGLESMTARFADWTDGLQGSAEFEDFLDYVHRTGPEVLDLLGSLTSTIVSIGTAAAPIGAVVVPALTLLSDGIGAIADSDLGTPLMGLITAYSTLRLAQAAFGAATRSTMGQAVVSTGRFAAATGRSALAVRHLYGDIQTMRAINATAGAQSQRDIERYGAAVTRTRSTLVGLGKGAAVLGAVGIAASGAAGSLGLTNTATMAMMGMMAGPWGAAVGGGVGLLMDFKAWQDKSAQSVKDLTGTLDAQTGAFTDASGKWVLDQLGDKTTDKLKKYGISIDEVVKATLLGGDSLKELGVNLFTAGDIASGITGKMYSPIAEDLGKLHDKAVAAGQAQGDQAAAAKGATSANQTYGRAATKAAEETERLATAVKVLNGWMDERSALSGYQDAIDALRKSMAGSKNWMVGSDNYDNLTAMGKAIEQVSDQLKGKRRDTFIKDAIVDLKTQLPAASASGRKQIQGLIDRLNGLRKKRFVDIQLNGIPKATTDIHVLQAQLAKLNGTKATTYIDVVKRSYDSKRAGLPQNEALGGVLSFADGGTMPGYTPGRDVHHFTSPTGGELNLSGGEAVMRPEWTAAVGTEYVDWANHMARTSGVEGLRAALGAPPAHMAAPSLSGRFAAGGVVGFASGGVVKKKAKRYGKKTEIAGINVSGLTVTQALAKLKKAATDASSALDATKASAEALSSSITDGLAADLWGTSSADMSPFTAAKYAPNSIAGANAALLNKKATSEEYLRLEKSLAGRGLKGAAFEELIKDGNIDRLRMASKASNAELAAYSANYAAATKATKAAASYGSDSIYDAKETRQTAELKKLNAAVHRIEAAQKSAKKAAQKRHTEAQKTRKAQPKATTKSLSSAATKAARP
ncbi:hypothetical protein [Nocardioides sp.]|uniref:hypothetical protein n=1 Tax=Nocardioides sp. TaxID=35761 RepID=UPI002614B92D|nr:hypothetical protein [Nocardioides sp.]